jgi:transposase
MSYQIRNANNTRYICKVKSFRNAKKQPDNKRAIIGQFDDKDRITLNDNCLNDLLENNISIDEKLNELYCYFYDRKKIKFNPKAIAVEQINPIDKIEESREISSDNTLLVNMSYLRNVLNFDHSMDLLSPTTSTLFSYQDIVDSQTLSFGNIYVLEELSRKIGLSQLLSKVFPKLSHKITTLVYYLVSTDEPFMYCDDWLMDNVGKIPADVMSSQSISRLLQTITDTERFTFFSEWAKLRNEKEYLALDITSISSYSELIGEAERGLNKENDDLDQINLCLLFGEKSGLPIYSTYYSGSLKDVSTLICTVKQMTSLCDKEYKLVMDKGFFSTKNILYLLNNHPEVLFVIAVPFTFNKAKDLCLNNSNLIHDKNRVVTSTQMLYGMKHKENFYNRYPLTYYSFFNPLTYQKKDSEIYKDLKILSDEIKKDISVYNDNPKAEKYILLSKKKNFEKSSEYIVQVNHDAVKNSLKNTGRMVLLSNDKLSTQDAIEIYRAKDVVERGFKKLKSSLDMRRVRAHSSNVMANKEFICFIALIILSYLDVLMSNNNLYKDYSIHKLLNMLKTLKLHIINDKIIINPLTKTQRELLEQFEILQPIDPCM